MQTEDTDATNYQELGNRPTEAPSIYTSVNQVGLDSNRSSNSSRSSSSGSSGSGSS